MSVSIELASKILSKFDGTKCKLYEFVDNCDKAYSLVTEANKPILFKIIETQLTDNARVLVRNRNFPDWPALKSHLISAYSEKRTIGQWQLELNSCRQNPKESIISYANKVENCYIKLINSLEDNLTTNAREACVNLLKSQALNVFITGLNRDIALIIKSQRPESLEEAINLALIEEQEQISKSEIYKYQQVNNTSTKHCTFCDKTGHSSFNCFSKTKSNFRVKQEPNVRHVQKSNSYQSPQFNKVNPPNNHSSYDNRKQCNYCKKSGHVISECRKRQYNNSRKQEPPNARNQFNSNTSLPSTSNTHHLNSNSSQAMAATPRTANHVRATFQ